jgi:hypothetical protein
MQGTLQRTINDTLNRAIRVLSFTSVNTRSGRARRRPLDLPATTSTNTPLAVERVYRPTFPGEEIAVSGKRAALHASR